MNALKCPKCGILTGGNEILCIECGQPLNITCPECGKEWQFMFNYNFCPGCGNNMKQCSTNKPEIQYFRDDELLRLPVNPSTQHPINV